MTESSAGGGGGTTIGEAARDGDLIGDPIYVRIATAVRLTGIGRSTLYELIGTGALDTVKVGRSTFIPYKSLLRLFDKH